MLTAPPPQRFATAIPQDTPQHFLRGLQSRHLTSNADSAWHEILKYFSAATQIGLTATPKETEYISNIHYFGKPVYTYSLKQGIRDGFLAPYKVIKVHIDLDVEGYRSEKGQTDRDGNEIEDRLYNTKDYDRVLVIDDRTKLVAQKVSALLKETPVDASPKSRSGKLPNHLRSDDGVLGNCPVGRLAIGIATDICR
jgi:superfamily II DNA or RNA helicase